jgi:hypothetical protein
MCRREQASGATLCRVDSLSPELALVDPELAERARAQLADPGSALPPPKRKGQPKPPHRSRGEWTAIVIGLALVAALVGAVWHRYGDDSSGSEETTQATTRPALRRDVAPTTPTRRRQAGASAPQRPLRPPPRPPAFHVPGAPKEPLDEISLPARARRLRAWLSRSRSLSRPNLQHWLYQHNWIVTGAGFGWWHGADALRILIRVDRRVEARWGVGHRSEAVARRALADIEQRFRPGPTG